jgi:hypothetical protein
MAEAYRTNHGSYVGMDPSDLRKIDPRLSSILTVASARRRTYCLTEAIHGRTWSISGPWRGNADLAAHAACA